MMCEKCGERSAEIHIVKVINGVRVEEDLCRSCAEQLIPFGQSGRGLRMSFSLEGIPGAEDMFRNLLLPMLPELYETSGEDFKCPHCGKEIEVEDLFGKPLGKANGVGEVLFDFSAPSFKRGSDRAVTDVKTAAPASDLETEGKSKTVEKELAGLKREMEFVLRGERYERAAQIRDRIKELEKNITEEETKGA